MSFSGGRRPVRSRAPSFAPRRFFPALVPLCIGDERPVLLGGAVSAEDEEEFHEGAGAPLAEGDS